MRVKQVIVVNPKHKPQPIVIAQYIIVYHSGSGRFLDEEGKKEHRVRGISGWNELPEWNIRWHHRVETIHHGKY